MRKNQSSGSQLRPLGPEQGSAAAPGGNSASRCPPRGRLTLQAARRPSSAEAVRSMEARLLIKELRAAVPRLGPSGRSEVLQPLRGGTVPRTATSGVARLCRPLGDPALLRQSEARRPKAARKLSLSDAVLSTKARWPLGSSACLMQS